MADDAKMREIAHNAERDLNTYQAKQGLGRKSDSVLESGVDQSVEDRFEGANVVYGSAASGAGNNRVIPAQEGGDQLPGPHGGRPTKTGDFEGSGGPVDKAERYKRDNPGADEVRENVRG